MGNCTFEYGFRKGLFRCNLQITKKYRLQTNSNIGRDKVRLAQILHLKLDLALEGNLLLAYL